MANHFYKLDVQRLIAPFFQKRDISKNGNPTNSDAVDLERSTVLAYLIIQGFGQRQHALYRQLTGISMRLLKEGESIAERGKQLSRLC